MLTEFEKTSILITSNVALITGVTRATKSKSAELRGKGNHTKKYDY
jgi:hypothetical protein